MQFFLIMNSKRELRVVKKHKFVESVIDSIVQVEAVMNRVTKIHMKSDIIDAKYLDRDLEDAYFDLELILATFSVMLRKMDENNYISIPQNLKKDINALIHSAKFVFDYDENTILVYSRRGEEEIDLVQLLKYGKEVTK